MLRKAVSAGLLAALFIAVAIFASAANAEQTCAQAVRELNAGLSPKLNGAELEEMLDSLNSSGNRRLPDKFVTKGEAKAQGWKPGRDLWSVKGLEGRSIGGDRFGNREGRLPEARWREADLDYHGGRRGSKRLIFSVDGLRFVTVDHYRTFMEVQPCRSK